MHVVPPAPRKRDTMALIALKCPNCNGDIQLDNRNQFGFCMYCGCKVMLQESIPKKITIDESDKVDSYLSLANDHLRNGLRLQALEYAEKVINIDPDNAQAWYIRSQCTDDMTERKMALLKAKDRTNDSFLLSQIQSSLDSISDFGDILIDFSETPIKDAISSLLRVTIDGKIYPVNVNSTTRIPLKKGHHKIEVSTSMNAVTKASASFVLKNTTKINVGCQKSALIKLKFILSIFEY